MHLRCADKDVYSFSQILAETAANVYIQDLAEFVAINKNLDGYKFYPMYVMDMSTIHYVE